MSSSRYRPIFRGIHPDPLAPGNVVYLLWMIMGYRLVQAVLVVTVGRLGDMYGRVRIYNAGFAVFTDDRRLAGTLPGALTAGLRQHAVPAGIAHQIGALPPVSSLFAAVLGVNPVQHVLAARGVLHRLPAASQRALTGRTFFPHLIAQPFHHGMLVVFSVAAGLSVVAGLAALLRGPRPAADPGA